MAQPETHTELGVRADSAGGSARVWSRHATGVQLCVMDDEDPSRVARRIDCERDGDVWRAERIGVSPGQRYAFRATGPSDFPHAFDPDRLLLDPYARGVAQASDGGWHGVVIDPSFDWGDDVRPGAGASETVIYEAHVKGLSAVNPRVPVELQGTYAGLAHPATVEHLLGLGVTAVELLPVHAFVSEQRLIEQGRVNYWGYNTLNFFAPHPAYATEASRAAGAGAVLNEFKGMVRLLHEAGLEVILDVVYNHTAEEGLGGPLLSLRGLDQAAYYRHDEQGYIDTTGCGNSLDFSRDVVRELALDSLRYWASEVHVDGFRFDLAVTTGRDENNAFDQHHRFLEQAVADPQLQGCTMIAEPWDLGPDGWRTGGFPDGWSEWNDRYRDDARTFWLRDVDAQRRHKTPSRDIGDLAMRVSGSADLYSPHRAPTSSVNFVTAHDGFSLADLVSFNRKHNLSNGEDNRDGTDDNRSYNHGREGLTSNPAILLRRRKAMRNLLATLLLSAGIPMLRCGDETGQSHNGNNNVYCQDNALTWVPWDTEQWQRDLYETTAALIRLRRENPALRPAAFDSLDVHVPQASRILWFDQEGVAMDEGRWRDPHTRTLQYATTRSEQGGRVNTVLVVFHGREREEQVVLPELDGVHRFSKRWDSGPERFEDHGETFAPSDAVSLGPGCVQVYLAD